MVPREPEALMRAEFGDTFMTPIVSGFECVEHFFNFRVDPMWWVAVFFFAALTAVGSYWLNEVTLPREAGYTKVELEESVGTGTRSQRHATTFRRMGEGAAEVDV